jgi:3-oxoacyl-[acyl-carrier protein] reductase
MDLNLKAKTAMVTGGSRGLGKSICRALAAEGANIIINCKTSVEAANALALEIENDYGVNALVVPCDVSEADGVKAMFQEALTHFNTIDVLINNAAIAPTSFIEDTTLEMWETTLKTNLTSAFLTSREIVRHLRKNKQKGRIVNISTASAFRGSTSGRAHYDTSKGGLISLTISMARELAAYGIAVNAIAAGSMLTEMSKERFLRNEEQYLKAIPLGRFGTTDEIADVVTFLASDKASYMTGTTLDVTGGMLMR